MQSNALHENGAREGWDTSFLETQLEIRNSAKKKLIKNIKGDIYFDELTRRIYAYSASICYLMPAAVIFPVDQEDVIQTIRIAAEENIPVTARGAGSGVAGQNLGEGIILDFSKYMKRILHWDSVSKTALVEPGVIRTRLLRNLLPKGLFFPPDPSSSDYATIGGMVANNSGGAHSLRYGTTKDYVKRIKLITSDAEEMIVTNQGITPSKYKKQVEELLKDASAVLKKNKPESFRNSSGYNLFDALSNNGEADLTKIFCGSEGTLGIFTEIEINLLELPRYRNAVLLCYKDDMTAFSEVMSFLELNPSTVQALDDEFLRIICSDDPEKYSRFPRGTHFIFLVEFDGDDLEDLKTKATELTRRSSAAESIITENSKELSWVWDIRRSAAAYLSRIPGNKPTRWIEDAAVPVENLPVFVLNLRNLLQKYNTSAALFGHAGQGLLHFSPRLNRMDSGFPQLIEDLGREHMELAKQLNGVPSGEHGDGLLRTPYLRQFWGDVYPFFKETKKIFDPKFILNPFSIVPAKEYRAKDFLRYYEGYGHQNSGALNSLIDSIEACHGCGKCTDFCPVTRSVNGEIGSSRARINLLREIIAGHLREPFDSPELLEYFHLCLHCKTCKLECPTGIDVAAILETYFEEKYIRKPAKLADKLLSKHRLMLRLASLTDRIIKPILSFKIIEKMTGLFGFSNLKHLSFDSLRRTEFPIRESEKGKRAVIFSGCTGDFFNSSEIRSTIKLLEKINFDAELVIGQCCGEPAFMRGFKSEGLAALTESITSLEIHIESETPVLFTSPSCLLSFLEQSRHVAKEDVCRKIQNCFFDAVSFFTNQILKPRDGAQLDSNNEFNSCFYDQVSNEYFNKTDLRIAVQIPCHLKAIKQESSLIELVRMLTCKDIIRLETKCCGFGGSRGLEKRWADHAQSIGKDLADEIVLKKPDIIVSSCITCRWQIRSLIGEKIMVSESADVFHFINSQKSGSNRILVVHPLILASELLK
jgi:FAD/FMN-containing dehydrogenase/Fe-S oxidoreductase